MNKKKIITIVIIIILLLLLITSGYLLFFNKTPKEDLEYNSNQTVEERKTINVEQGDLLTMESENISFYIPKDWTSKKDLDENYVEYHTLEGNGLTLTLRYLPVEDGSKWTNHDNIEYSTSTSRLYKEDGVYQAIFNSSQTRILEDYENNIRTEQDYGLFLIINKNNNPVETLTMEDYSYIKFILDSYDLYNSY
jgi:hypothetical protein